MHLLLSSSSRALRHHIAHFAIISRITIQRIKEGPQAFWIILHQSRLVHVSPSQAKKGFLQRTILACSPQTGHQKSPRVSPAIMPAMLPCVVSARRSHPQKSRTQKTHNEVVYLRNTPCLLHVAPTGRQGKTNTIAILKKFPTVIMPTLHPQSYTPVT